MIKINRSPKPKILQEKESEWLNNLKNASNEGEKKKAQKKYGNRKVKNALMKMFHGKCAYCESKINHIDYGDIEHYRPKSKFEDLTFEWSNLLLACSICNNNKGDEFPEQDEDGPIINPCDDEPNEHFDFVFKDKIASVYGTTSRGMTTEKILELNRYDLRTRRSEFVRNLAVIMKNADSDPEAKCILEEVKHDYAEYAAFARIL